MKAKNSWRDNFTRAALEWNENLLLANYDAFENHFKNCNPLNFHGALARQVGWMLLLNSHEMQKKLLESEKYLCRFWNANKLSSSRKFVLSTH